MSERSKSNPVVMLALSLAMGLALIGNSVWRIFIHPTDLDSYTATASGTIVKVDKRYSDGDDYYRPTISFEDSDHISHEAPSVVEYTRHMYKGTEVTVRYDPFHPDDGCIIKGDEGRHHRAVFGLYASLVMGVVISGFGIWVFFKRRAGA